MDLSALEKEHIALVEVARTGRFEAEPDSSEWNGAFVLAHLIASNRQLATTAASLADGDPVTIDNRITQSRNYLAAIVAAAGDWSGLVDAFDQSGHELLEMGSRLEEAVANTAVPSYLVHAGEVRVDGDFVFANFLGEFHVVGHREQLERLST
jgi:hypothetical protein